MEKNVSEFDEDIIKSYSGNKGYISDVDIEYPKSKLILCSDLPFLPERMKI